jgi:hypothetical protein
LKSRYWLLLGLGGRNALGLFLILEAQEILNGFWLVADTSLQSLLLLTCGIVLSMSVYPAVIYKDIGHWV